MKNKRGLSTIVGTMLTVLLTIIAATVLWAVISNVSDINEGSSQDCLTLDLEVLACGVAAAGCYNIEGTWLQIPDPAQITTTPLPAGIAWAIIRRNQGHGDLQTAKFILEVSGQRVAGDLIDYDIHTPAFKYQPRKDLSGLKEYATEHIASANLGGIINIVLNNPTAPISATVAPVVAGGIACQANEKLVPCWDLGQPACQICPCP